MLNFSNNIISFLQTALSIWGLLALIGFIIYKCNRSGTWEGGVKLALFSSIKFIIATFSETPNTEAQINASLYLTDTEILDLVDCFQNRPFNTPTLATPIIYDNNDCMWLDIKASGFIDLYQNTALMQLKQMTESIVQKFYQRNRNLPTVSVYTKIIAPDRLLLAIPLSGHGERFLKNQESNNIIPKPEIPATIEEELKTFDDISGG